MNLQPTLTKSQQQAYELVEQAFMLMLQAAMQHGISPDRLLEPYAQKLAAIYATVKIRGGNADLEDMLNKLRIECNASVRKVLGDRGSLN